MQRRLPVYLLLDTSDSMVGEPLYQLEEVVRGLIRALTQDPRALESVSIECIVFAGKARVILPLTELSLCELPELPIGGGTSLGSGLQLLMNEIQTNLRKPSESFRGDWKPLVFLVTDGVPTDEWKSAAARWQTEFSSKAKLIAVAISEGTDLAVLQTLTDVVVTYLDSTPESLQSFVAWMTQSIVHSTHIEEQLEEPRNLVEPDGVHVKKVEGTNFSAVSDDRFVIVVGRCSETKRPYLLRYVYARDFIETLDLPDALSDANYLANGAFQLRESYFDMTSGEPDELDVSELLGQDPCPHCGNQATVATHGNCGGILCVSGDGTHICPWCGEAGEYSSSEDSDEEMKIKRSLG